MRLLSDREEARLGALAAMRRLPMREGVIGDLGGGSLQLTRVRAGRITSAAGVPVGAVRMTRRFLRGDPPTPREIRALRDQVRDASARGPARGPPGRALLGARRHGAHARPHAPRRSAGPRRKRHALCLPLADVTALRERIEALPLRKRRRIPGLKAERADIILAGVITVEEVMRFGGYGRSPCAREASGRHPLGGNLHGAGGPRADAGLGPKPEMTATAYINRELSWLEFNRRVLEEAQDPTVPLLERVKFLAIFSSNLDEFFMVRVAGLKRQRGIGRAGAGPDGLTARETLAAVSERVHELVAAQHRCFLDEIQPLLAAEGVRILRPEDLDAEQRASSTSTSGARSSPSLTPLAIDPGHPFPHLANRSLCLVASIRPVASSLLPHASLAVVHIPGLVVPRFVALPAAPGQHAFVLLEDVIRLHLPRLYNGYEVDLLPRHPGHPRRRVRGEARPRR